MPSVLSPSDKPHPSATHTPSPVQFNHHTEKTANRTAMPSGVLSPSDTPHPSATHTLLHLYSFTITQRKQQTGQPCHLVFSLLLTHHTPKPHTLLHSSTITQRKQQTGQLSFSALFSSYYHQLFGFLTVIFPHSSSPPLSSCCKLQQTKSVIPVHFSFSPPLSLF